MSQLLLVMLHAATKTHAAKRSIVLASAFRYADSTSSDADMPVLQSPTDKTPNYHARIFYLQ